VAAVLGCLIAAGLPRDSGYVADRNGDGGVRTDQSKCRRDRHPDPTRGSVVAEGRLYGGHTAVTLPSIDG
jgi:hypothetical protein